MSVDDVLAGYLGEVQRDSSGKFSLEPSKALQKLAHFSLARPGDWVLKVVQAAVASDAGEIRGKLRLTSASFDFTPANWNYGRLLQAVCDPEPSGVRALDHLRVALWDCFRARRSFRLQSPSERYALTFDGRWLTEEAVREPVSGVRLWFGLSRRGAFFKARPEVRAELSLALRDSAFVCPIPLWLDTVRLDGPGRASGLPMAELFARGEAPPLELPEARKRDASALCRVRLARHGGHTRDKSVDQVCWILDGVIVKQTFMGEPLNDMWGTVFLSAAGLRCDVSGVPADSPELQQRLQSALLALEPAVREMKLPEQVLVNEMRAPAPQIPAWLKPGLDWMARKLRVPESTGAPLVQELGSELAAEHRLEAARDSLFHWKAQWRLRLGLSRSPLLEPLAETPPAGPRRPAWKREGRPPLLKLTDLDS